MLRKTASALILSIAFLPAVLTAQEPANGGAEASAPAAKQGFSLNGKKISIEEAIKLVLQNNKDLLDARYDAKMADSNYQKFLSKYSIYLGADGGLQYQNNPESIAPSQGDTVKTYNGSVSAMKNFMTGTTLSAGLQEKAVRTDYPYPFLPLALSSGSDYAKYPTTSGTYYTPALFVNVQQELLKNSFGYNDRQQEKMLQNATKLIQMGQEAKISGLVALNSLMAMVGGTLAAVALGRNDPGFVHNGPLAGLVAVCAGSDIMHPLGALVVGGVAGALFVYMFTLTQNRWKIDDVLGVWPLHGLCGAWGGVAAGLFGQTALGGAGGVAFMPQLLMTGLVIVIALAGSFAVYGLLRATLGLRLSREEEFNGADLSIHRISASPERETNW